MMMPGKGQGADRLHRAPEERLQGERGETDRPARPRRLQGGEEPRGSRRRGQDDESQSFERANSQGHSEPESQDPSAVRVTETAFDTQRNDRAGEQLPPVRVQERLIRC